MYLTRKLKLGRTDQLDALARRAGDLWSNVAKWHWRFVDRQGYWLSTTGCLRAKRRQCTARALAGCTASRRKRLRIASTIAFNRGVRSERAATTRVCARPISRSDTSRSSGSLLRFVFEMTACCASPTGVETARYSSTGRLRRNRSASRSAGMAASTSFGANTGSIQGRREKRAERFRDRWYRHG